MPKSSMERSVRKLVVLLGMLHISLVSLLRTLSSFRILGLEKELHSRHKLCLVQ